MDIIIIILLLIILFVFEKKLNIKAKYSKFSDKVNATIVDVIIFMAVLTLLFFLTLPLFEISKLIFGAVFLSILIYSIYIIFPF